MKKQALRFLVVWLLLSSCAGIGKHCELYARSIQHQIRVLR